MDDRAKYEALKSEFEAIPAYFLRPETEAQVAYVRAFKDEGGMVRLDVATEDAEDHLQLVIGKTDLLRRLADPQ